MTTDELIINNDRFVMLDLVDTICENQIVKSYPLVQIVDSSDNHPYKNVEAIKSRVENTIKSKEKREDLFTITLNVDEDYKNKLFR